MVVGDYLYIISRNGLLDKINTRTFTIEDTVDLAAEGEAMTTDGQYIYVGAWSDPVKILRISVSPFAYIDSFTFGPVGSYAAGMHIAGTTLYIGTYDSPGRVVRVNLAKFTNAGITVFNAGEDAAEEMDDDGTYLYVPLQNSSQIGRIALSTNRLESVISLPAGVEEPQEVIVQGRYVYIATRAGSADVGLARVPTDNFTDGAIKTITFPSDEDVSAALATDGTYIYVFGDNRLVGLLGDDDTEDNANTTRWLAQTFTTTASYTLNGVKLYAFEVDPLGDVTVSIKAVDGDGKPTGPDLTSATVDASNWGARPTWRSVALPDLVLAAATQYAVVIKASEPDLGWRFDLDNGYAGGRRWTSTDSGITWGGRPVADFLFQTNHDPKTITRVSISPFAYVDSYKLPGSASHGGPEVLKLGDDGFLYACDYTRAYKLDPRLMER